MKTGVNKIYLSIIFFLLLNQSFLKAQFQVNGNADSLNCECFLLTHAVNNENGSVWYKNTIALTDTFDATFLVYLGVEDVWGADGIVFAFQQNGIAALGGDGSPKGFNGVSPSVGVGIDTHDGAPNDIPEDHLSIYTNGNTTVDVAGPIPARSDSGNIEDGQYHELHIFWDPATNTLYVYFDGDLRLTYTNDIINNIFGGNPNVYFGFTGATGGLNNEQRFCLKNTADFSIENICANNTTKFINETNFLINNNLTYQWDFGDGNSSVQYSPTHTYMTPGTYSVTLIAEDQRTCKDTTTQKVTIYEADVTLTATPDSLCGIHQSQLMAVTLTDYQPQCYYYLTLSDLWGDGWDGASLDIYVNGQLAAGFTATDFGFNGTPTTEQDSILLTNGQTVSLVYNPGNYEYEHSYSFSDYAQNLLFSDGPSPATGTVFTTTVSCPQDYNVSITWNESMFLDDTTRFNPVANISATQTFHTTVTYSFGCVFTDSITIFYTSGDSPGLDNNILLCSSASPVNMFDSLKGNPVSNGVWYNSNNQIVDNIFDPQVETPDTFYYIISGPNVCADSSAMLIVEVEEQPDAGNNTLIDVCKNQMAFNLIDSVSGNPDTTGYWLDAAFNPHSGVYIPSSDTSGWYWYIVNGSLVCPADSSKITVNNHTIPSVSVTELASISCYGFSDAQIEISAMGNSPFSYQWNTGDNTAQLQLGAGQYFITVTDIYGCNAVTSITISQPSPLVIDSLATTETSCKNFCDATATIYVSGGTSPYYYSWLGIIDSIPTTSSLCTGNYNVTVYDKNGCQTVENNVVISTKDSLQADFIFASASFIAPADVVFYNQTTGGDSTVIFFWDFEIAESNEAQPLITFSDTGSFTVQLIAQDIKGCTDTISKTLYIDASQMLIIPNVFSPNGDGINDVFEIQTYGYEIERMDIYNRWGEQIISNQQTNIWDGKTFSGKLVPAGTYYYVLSIKQLKSGEEKSYKGYIQLIH